MRVLALIVLLLVGCDSGPPPAITPLGNTANINLRGPISIGDDVYHEGYWWKVSKISKVSGMTSGGLVTHTFKTVQITKSEE